MSHASPNIRDIPHEDLDDPPILWYYGTTVEKDPKERQR